MKNNYQRYASIIAFSIIIFISFFGTSEPFPDRYKSVDDIGTSNFLNQVIYIFVLLLAFYSIHSYKRELFSFIKSDKFLSLLILWYFIGMMWSIDPFSTFKMALRLFTIFISISAFFIHHPYFISADQILKYIAALFVLTSIVIVALIPGATDPDFNTWRGLSPSKNIFGQVSVLTLIITLDIYLRQNTLINKTILLTLAFISIILLFGSQSSTSIIGFLAFCSIISIRAVDKLFRPLNLGRFLSSAIVVSFAFSVVLLLVVFPNILESFTALFGKDPSFTGRTDLWLIALNSFRDHFPFGTAYGAFWNAANKDLVAIHIIFPWLPMQAHSGILDTLNEGGIIGFILFISATIKVLIQSWKFRDKNLWFYMILIILVLNTQETTIFVPGYLATTIFILIYVRSIFISSNPNKMIKH